MGVCGARSREFLRIVIFKFRGRHGIVKDYKQYAHTRVKVEMEDAIKWARENNAFLEGVPYKRYEKRDGPAR